MIRKIVVLFILLCVLAGCGSPPLPNWNDGPTRSRILAFVHEVCNPHSEQFVPPQLRIAVFDLDGTLTIEKPDYSNVLFLTAFVQQAASRHPEMHTTQPYAAILNNDTNYLRNHYSDIYTQVFADSSLTAYHRYVDAFLQTSHPIFEQVFYKSCYQPMAELIQLLEHHDFTVYICSGSQQEFVRRFAALALGLPPEHCIGSTMQWNYHENHFIRTNRLLHLNDHSGKCQSILDRIGQKPILCFGNSTGDSEMLQLTASNSLHHLCGIIIHDDPQREVEYHKSALEEIAQTSNWLQVSMKQDFKVVQTL